MIRMIVVNQILFVENLVKCFFSFLLKKTFVNSAIKKERFYDFPIYIISFNRLSFLKQTVEWLRKYGYHNINIIDNHSNYPPLVEYLKSCGCNVFWMKKNYGHKVFFKHPKFFFVRNFRFFAITDPDLKPVENCPKDFVEKFLSIMNEYPKVSKVGFSLKIDDLPDSYNLKEEVVEWERRFYQKKLNSKYGELFDADIDTTFAVMSPLVFVSRLKWYRAIRVGYPYQVHHLPWYGEKESEELSFYRNSIRKDVSNWNGNFSKKEIKNRYSL